MELKDQIAGYLQEATKEAVSILLGVEIKVVGSGAPEVGGDDVIAAVNFTGTMAGRAVVVMSGRGACAIASKILTREIVEVNPEVKDKVSEILNMVLGCLKTRLRGIGQDFIYQSPAVIKAEDFKTPELAKAETIYLTVAIDQTKCRIVLMYQVPEAAPLSGKEASIPTEEKGAAAPASSAPQKPEDKAIDVTASSPETKNAFDVLKEAVAEPPAEPAAPAVGEKVQPKEEAPTRAADFLKNFIVAESPAPLPQEKAGSITPSVTAVPDGTGTSRGAQQEKEVPSKPLSLTGEADPSGATADAPSMGSNTRGVIPAEMATTRPPEEKPEAKNSDSMAQPGIKNDLMKATASEKNAEPVKKDEDIYAEAMQQLEALLAEMKKQQNNHEK